MENPATAAEKKNPVVDTLELEKGGADEAADMGVGGRGSATRTAETVLRVVPMGLCVAAMVVMLRNAVSSDEYGSISYSDLSGFQYLVYANGACAAYSLLSAFYTAAPRQSSSSPTLLGSWAIYFLDQVLTYVVLTAAAASTEILYLAYNGNKEVTWSEGCSSFGGFCGRAKASVGITFAAVVCYVALSLVSSFRLFSSYDAPIPFLGKGAGVAAYPG